MSAKDKTLDQKILDLLDGSDRLFLSTSVDGNSSGASVFYARDGQDLVFFTFNPSRKAEQIRVNPRVQAVIWPKGQEGIRGLQIDGECFQIRDSEESARAHDLILNVTSAFQAYMDDDFLKANKVVGYYRLKPTVVKFVDFYAPTQFEWREYPENMTGPWKMMFWATWKRIGVWIRAVRAPFFTAAVVPILLGAVIAYGDLKAAGAATLWNWSFFWLVLLGGIMAQAGTNMGNDYYDHTSRNDELNKLFSPFNGGSRMIQAGLLPPWKVLSATLLFFAGTVYIGLKLNTVLGGSPLVQTPLLWLGILGVALGMLYTMSPVRLGYKGLGEISIALGFGPVMALGTHYVLTAPLTRGMGLEWNWPAPLLASIPIGILIMLVVWINQFQDASADARVGKNTWVVRLAESHNQILRYERPFKYYTGFNYISFAFILGLGLLGLLTPGLATPLALVALIPAVLMFYAVRWGREWIRRWNQPGADRQKLPYELLKVNVSTIGVHFLTGVLLTVGYWVDARFF